jgi:signal transduction histidine kinase
VSRRVHSIRLRLTLWYAGSILLLFAAGGLALRVALRQAMLQEFERQLEASAALVRGFFRSEREEWGTTEETIGHLAGDMLVSEQVIDFRQPTGARFAIVRPHRRQRPVPLDPPTLTVTVPLDAELAPGWTIQIRGSAAALDRQRRRLDLSLLAGIPMLFLFAGAVGWWLTGRTLRPVGEMADATEGIDPAHPSARLPIARADDELGRLGARFNTLLERLESALAQQRRFLADAAHELRTPIARMSHTVELALAERGGDGRDARHTLERVAADLHRGALLVDELLQLARADAGERDARLERRFLDDLVMDSAGAWQPAAARRGVALTLSVLEEAPAACDPALVDRLLGVLLDNAIRYTGTGGRVDVRVRRDDGHAILEVEDTGIGIPPEERPHVFERFFRGAAARSVAPEGSGLGLPIALWIAQRHGGRLTLAPGAAGGTLARLELPASGNGADSPPAAGGAA